MDWPNRTETSLSVVPGNATIYNGSLKTLTISNMEDSSPFNEVGYRDLSEWTVMTVIGYLILIFITLVGNILVIAAFFRDPTLQAITNYWIISLALTDIILASTVMPIQVKRELTAEQKWTLGPFVCDLFISLDVLNCTCSIYHLGLISLDRYLCVRFPLWYPSFRSVRKTLWAILVTWLWCTIISLPRFLFKNANAPNDDCQMSEPGYMIFSSFMSFYIPLILCLAMYYGVFRITRSRSIKLKRERAQSIPGGPSTLGGHSPSNPNQQRRGRKLGKDGDAVVTTGDQHYTNKPSSSNIIHQQHQHQQGPLSPVTTTTTTTLTAAANYSTTTTTLIQQQHSKKKQHSSERRPKTHRCEDSDDSDDVDSSSSPSNYSDRLVNSGPETDFYYHQPPSPLDYHHHHNQRVTTAANDCHHKSSGDKPFRRHSSYTAVVRDRIRSNSTSNIKTDHSPPPIPPPTGFRQRQKPRLSHDPQGAMVIQRASTAGLLLTTPGSPPKDMDLDEDDHPAQTSTTHPLVSQKGFLHQPPQTTSNNNNNNRRKRQSSSRLIELRRIQRLKQRISQTNFFANNGDEATGKFDHFFSSTSSNPTAVLNKNKNRKSQVEKTASQKLRKKRQRQESRTAKIVLIVLGSFVALWLPFFLANVIWPLCKIFSESGTESCGISENVWKIVTWLGYCNSAVNPFIYTYFNRTFRRAIFRIIRCDFTGSLNNRPRRR